MASKEYRRLNKRERLEFAAAIAVIVGIASFATILNIPDQKSQLPKNGNTELEAALKPGVIKIGSLVLKKSNGVKVILVNVGDSSTHPVIYSILAHRPGRRYVVEASMLEKMGRPEPSTTFYIKADKVTEKANGQISSAANVEIKGGIDGPWEAVYKRPNDQGYIVETNTTLTQNIDPDEAINYATEDGKYIVDRALELAKEAVYAKSTKSE